MNAVTIMVYDSFRRSLHQVLSNVLGQDDLVNEAVYTLYFTRQVDSTVNVYVLLIISVTCIRRKNGIFHIVHDFVIPYLPTI